MSTLHHHVVKVNLDEILPTQTSVGYIEVANKRNEWASLTKIKRQELIGSHWFPSVIGPDNRYYIVDHHHLGLALHQEGHKNVLLTVLKDLSMLDLDNFWKVMSFSSWVYPYNNHGKRIKFSDIPQHISELADDPYRSLAGLSRDRGAYAKSTTPFTEFMWADYYRPLIKKKQIVSSTDGAIKKALEVAKLPAASYLPGWVGKASDLAKLK